MVYQEGSHLVVLVAALAELVLMVEGLIALVLPEVWASHTPYLVLQ
jgi:uncharacterized protein YjeT (DUF2065 family)